jgi:hypothetical protein
MTCRKSWIAERIWRIGIGKTTIEERVTVEVGGVKS